MLGNQYYLWFVLCTLVSNLIVAKCIFLNNYSEETSLNMPECDNKKPFKKDRQHNEQKKKDKQWYTKHNREN